MKAMKAYFAINPTTYATDDVKTITMPNKMSKGWGDYFSETWYDKVADPAIKAANKTFDKIAEAFTSMFYPYNHVETVKDKLNLLWQIKTKADNSF